MCVWQLPSILSRKNELASQCLASRATITLFKWGYLLLLRLCSSCAISEPCGGNLCTAVRYSVSSVAAHAHLSQQLISSSNLCSARERVEAAASPPRLASRINICASIWASPLLLHSSTYRLVFPAGFCAHHLTDLQRVRVGIELGSPEKCV